jgi:hypothetical protein
MSLLHLSDPKDLIPTVGVLTSVYQVPSKLNVKEDVRTKDHKIYLTFMSFKGKIPAKPAVLGFQVTEEMIFRQQVDKKYPWPATWDFKGSSFY